MTSTPEAAAPAASAQGKEDEACCGSANTTTGSPNDNKDVVTPLPSELLADSTNSNNYGGSNGNSGALTTTTTTTTTSSPISSPTTNGRAGRAEAYAHHRQTSSSSLSDFTVLELDRNEQTDVLELVVNNDPEHHPELPKDSLVVVAETKKIEEDDNVLHNIVTAHNDPDITTDLNEFTLEEGKFKCNNWAGKKGYSDYIKDGMRYNDKSQEKVVMIFESPTWTATPPEKFRFHTWPPAAPTAGKSVVGPCRYASMNGTSYPVFLKDGAPPAGLQEHWQRAIPNFKSPTYLDQITDAETAYCYLPIEDIQHHVNDPNVHYHLAGKDAIHLMTQKTTELLPDTRTIRPCVVKTTHSMGSRGIFIIQNDNDEAEFLKYLEDSGNPRFVVTGFVDIARNVACHFFMHPNGSIVWFGSNENHRDADGRFSTDSYLIWEHQDKLKEIQLPFVQEVVQYCHGLGFWGFCGIDVLFDSKDRGYLVDINPRVTGSCPALMTLKLLVDKFNFSVGLFRRSGDNCFFGTPDELLSQVHAYNDEKDGKSRVVIHSFFNPPGTSITKVNIGVYGNNLNECKTVLNRFAKAPPPKHDEKLL